MTKLAVFSRQNLIIAVNSFSLMCTITLTMPQFLHAVYNITVDRAPGRFSSHHFRNCWSILCLNSMKKKIIIITSAHPPPFSNLCGGQTNNFFWPKWYQHLLIDKTPPFLKWYSSPTWPWTGAPVPPLVPWTALSAVLHRCPSHTLKWDIMKKRFCYYNNGLWSISKV